ncbi:hypothetical protein BKA66DRAFT_436714 [Pyrenochaeta sp. MPI-SDFR-AT-0127]|nr:hypothetical protein BKA66DRAFT_436714 [Pyrenochaeta sp. MPI-SDFR-AT-0127]
MSWSGPGVILSFVRLHRSARITEEAGQIWFHEEYVPRLLASGVVSHASHYKAANPDYDKQQLAVYKVPDLALVHAGKLTTIARNSDRGLFDGDVDDVMDFESRIYSLGQLYETSKQTEEAAPTIMLAMMQPSPGGEADLDAWYREEHNQQMSEQPGWRRTLRYNLLFQHGNDFRESPELSFLAIHEFGEGNELGMDVKALEPISDWTKKVMSDAKAIDAAIYHKIKAFE